MWSEGDVPISVEIREAGIAVSTSSGASPAFESGSVIRAARNAKGPVARWLTISHDLYRLGNVVSFALGRGLAFDPIREYGKLRTVGYMGHVREYTASEVRRFLTRAGFGIVEVARRAAPRRHGKLVNVVHRLLPSVRDELVITARSAPIPNGLTDAVQTHVRRSPNQPNQ